MQVGCSKKQNKKIKIKKGTAQAVKWWKQKRLFQIGERLKSAENGILLNIAYNLIPEEKGGFLVVFFLRALLSVCYQVVIMLYTVLLATCSQSVFKL